MTINEKFTKDMVNQNNSKKKTHHSKKNTVSVRIENVVASIDLGRKINLDMLLGKYSDMVKKKNFPGIIVKIKYPKSTILIFKSGKLVLTGLKMAKYVPIIVEKIINKLENAKIKLKQKPVVKVENIVSRGDFHQRINLDIASLILNRAIYEPEVFPGLIYKRTDPKVCFLIFSSGKIICTGASSEDVIKKSIKNLAIKLKKNDVLGRKKKDFESINLDDLLN